MESANQVDRQVGDRLRLRRTAQEMSREKLAGALGVTILTVYEWEAGMSRVGAARLSEVAKILGVSPGYFFADMHRGATLH